MKNAMKKLLSLVLVAMLLVSVVPMGAMAADGFTVDVTIKDETGDIKTESRSQNAGDAYTAGDYLNDVYHEWANTYEVAKVWMKNSDTGSDGTDIDLSNTITKDTRLVIKLVHKDITVSFDVYQDGNYKYTNTASYDYGTKLTLDAALASSVGIPGAKDVRCDAKGLSMGNTLTVNEGNIKVQVILPTSEQKPTDPPATEKKDVTMTVKVEGENDKTSSFKLKGESAPLSDLLYYYYAKDWKNNYNFVRAYRSGENITDLSAAIYGGDDVSVRLEKKGETNPPAPDKNTVTMKFLFNDSQDVSERVTVEIKGKSTTIADLLTHKWDSNWSSKYEFVRANCEAGTVTDINTTIYAGETINIRLRDKNVKPDVNPVHYVIKLDSSNNILAEGDKTPANGKYLVVRDLLDNWSSNWNGNYDFSHAQVKGSDKNIGLDGTVDAGKTVYIMLESEGGSASEQYTVYFNDADNNVVYSAKVNKGEVIGSKIAEAARDEVKNDKKGYTFEGWRLNGAGNILSTNTIAHTTVKTSLSYYPVYSKNGSDSDKLNSNKVYLHIFLDNKVSPPAKDINITDGIAKDGVVTMGEVQDVVKKYYSAKNDDGIKYDGMYMATGSWVGEFVRDDKIDRIDNIDELKKDGYVHINVMVNNAKAKSNSNADSSNPKTGDDIYMTVTVMGLSAAALCAVYFVSKKRAVR